MNRDVPMNAATISTSYGCVDNALCRYLRCLRPEPDEALEVFLQGLLVPLLDVKEITQTQFVWLYGSEAGC